MLGLGYIGLPTAAILADSGYEVIGVDVDADVRETVARGEIHIVEPSLDKVVASVVSKGHLSVSNKPKPSDIFIICVPTPFLLDEDHPKPNVDHVMSAADSIAPVLTHGNLVILESTVPVGTTDAIAHLFQKTLDPDCRIHVAHCPERVLPGQIMKEFVENDRIIGGLTDQASDAAEAFYETFTRGSIHQTSAKTAELCKLAENSFRDTNIAFANELSMICGSLDIDVWELIKLANKHPRVNILEPGAGVGGHCIPVDPWFVVSQNPESARLIKRSRDVNLEKERWVIREITLATERFAASVGKPPRIACMGLSFKPNVDDLRESPAVRITEHLIKLGLQVLAVEPNLLEHNVFELTEMDAAVSEADIFVFLVKHERFVRGLPFIVSLDRPILDFCGITK